MQSIHHEALLLHFPYRTPQRIGSSCLVQECARRPNENRKLTKESNGYWVRAIPQGSEKVRLQPSGGYGRPGIKKSSMNQIESKKKIVWHGQDCFQNRI